MDVVVVARGGVWILARCLFVLPGESVAAGSALPMSRPCLLAVAVVAAVSGGFEWERGLEPESWRQRLGRASP